MKSSLPPVADRLLRSPVVRALTWPHGIDRYLELLNPLWASDEGRAVVIAVQRETRDTSTLTLRPRQWDGALAGQHVCLTVAIAGVRRTRCFSLSSSQYRADGTVQVTVRAHPGGLVSRWLNHEARPGTVVGLSPAAGDFILPAERPRDLLFISGGSGITPVMSMLRTLCDERHTGRVTFLHYARQTDDVIFGDELARLDAAHPNLRVVIVPTRATGGTELRGRLTRAHLDAVAPTRRDAETYVCGPAALLDAVTSMWADDGLAERLHFERFQLAADATADGGDGGTVAFARSGATVISDGRTLLDQAEAAGLTPTSGCRMGICHTCVRRKTAGRVRDVRNGACSTEDAADIQLCVSVPVGDVAIDL